MKRASWAVLALILGAYPTLAEGRVARMSASEMSATVGGAGIQIVAPRANVVNTTEIDNPSLVYKAIYAGTDTLNVYSYVNGTKTALFPSTQYTTSWDTAPNNAGYLRTPWPIPSQANVELEWWSSSANSSQAQSATVSGSAPKTAFTWDKKLKIAGVNFWNVTVGSDSASYSSNDELNATDAVDPNLRWLSSDAILDAENVTDYKRHFVDGANCSLNSYWQFKFRQSKALTLSDANCLHPTIAAENYTSLGPTPSCPNFASLVTNALAAQDPNYGDYVNVVIVKHVQVWNGSKYDNVAVEGFHAPSAKWVSVAAGDGPRLGTLIVHEWGHQVGLNHAPDSECHLPLTDQPVMCPGNLISGLGVDKTFCDAIAAYTGTKNWNPNK